jgi:hypothetical protein
MERSGLPTRDVLLLFCIFALRKDERKPQYSRSNILGFINTGYFTSDNKVPHGIKNATHNTFSNFRKKLANEIKISSFFRKWLNTNKRLIFNARTKITSVSFSMLVTSLKVFIMLDS